MHRKVQERIEDLAYHLASETVEGSRFDAGIGAGTGKLDDGVRGTKGSSSGRYKVDPCS